MQVSTKEINLVLIASDSGRSSMLRDAMARCGVDGVIRRIKPGDPAIDCALQQGPYRDKPLPDLFFVDFTDPGEETIAVLNAIAFGDRRAPVPVVLITSPQSQELLDSGTLAADSAVMFSPTSLPSFMRKMKLEKRPSFFKALRTLYQYGPILVRSSVSAIRYDRGPTVQSA
ncbi:MAG: hypothetical protein WBN07_12775 [Woeseiaceae bacterium]